MSGFNDQAYAQKFRDLVTKVARKVIDEERPLPKLGKVFRLERSSNSAYVLLAGETVENLMKVRVAQNMRPTTLMETSFQELGYDAPGDIVRIEGRPGSYYISAFHSGVATTTELTPEQVPEYSPVVSVTPAIRSFVVKLLTAIPNPTTYIKYEVSRNATFTDVVLSLESRQNIVTLGPLPAGVDYWFRTTAYNVVGVTSPSTVTGPVKSLVVEDVDVAELSLTVSKMKTSRHQIY